MTANEKTCALLNRLQGFGLDFEGAETLRRAQLTLHRWAENSCGDSNDFQSWCLERDEDTGKPYMAMYPHTGKSYRYAVPDKEAGALRRVAALAKEHDFHFYHQTDPRGCALYVSKEPLTDTNYNCGIAIY